MPEYASLVVTSQFLDSLISREFSERERRRFIQALRLLDTNEKHPSLRVHQLQGKEHGLWTASASDELRITFMRSESGRKVLEECSRHYND